MNIDEIAEDIVNEFSEERYLETYTGWNRDSLLQSTLERKKQAIKKMLHQIDYDESRFSVVKNPYTVAKSLYFILTEDTLSDEEIMSTIKLCYFCLLKNYLKNKDELPTDFNLAFGNLISGCKLALVLFSMQGQFLISLIASLGLFVNPTTHLRNQLLLFAGIIEEAENIVDTEAIWPVGAVIKDYYVGFYKELESQIHIPTGRELTMLKDSCTSVIKDIVSDISVNFKEPNWMDF